MESKIKLDKKIFREMLIEKREVDQSIIAIVDYFIKESIFKINIEFENLKFRIYSNDEIQKEIEDIFSLIENQTKEIELIKSLFFFGREIEVIKRTGKSEIIGIISLSDGISDGIEYSIKEGKSNRRGAEILISNLESQYLSMVKESFTYRNIYRILSKNYGRMIENRNLVIRLKCENEMVQIQKYTIKGMLIGNLKEKIDKKEIELKVYQIERSDEGKLLDEKGVDLYLKNELIWDRREDIININLVGYSFLDAIVEIDILDEEILKHELKIQEVIRAILYDNKESFELKIANISYVRERVEVVRLMKKYNKKSYKEIGEFAFDELKNRK